MEQISFKDKKAIFDRLEQVASQANLSPEERAHYEEEWKRYNDYFNTLESSKKQGRKEGKEEGRKEGRAEEKLNLAKNMKEKGCTAEFIADITGLTPEEIEKL